MKINAFNPGLKIKSTLFSTDNLGNSRGGNSQLTTYLCQGNPTVFNSSLLDPPDDHVVKRTGCSSANMRLRRDGRASSLACLDILQVLYSRFSLMEIETDLST